MENTVESKKSLKLLVLIVERGKGDDVAAFLHDIGQPFCYHFYGRGTACSNIMDLLGLGDSQKDVMLTVVPSIFVTNILKRLNEKFGLEGDGCGIAFTIRLNSVAGQNALKFLSGSEEERNGQ